MNLKLKFKSLVSAVHTASHYPGGHFNRCRIFCDFLKLSSLKAITPEEYLNFEFDKQSDKFKLSFLGEHEQRFYLALLNPVKYYIIARNKFVAHKMFEDTGIRTSQMFCYYAPDERVTDSCKIAYDLKGVLAIIKLSGLTEFVIKTTESYHGINVYVVKNVEFVDEDCILQLFNGESVKLSEVLSDVSLIFETLIHQTSQFESFNPSSVNTVRFMTTLWPDGTAKVNSAFIKIGRVGSCVDNAGDGGNIDACVDVETGRIKYPIQFDGWGNAKDITCHPDSCVQLDGTVIDNWDSIKADVIRFQQAFPWCRAAGWDIAITDGGPVVVEVNDFWDRTGQFFIRRGWRDDYRECYFAWKKAGLKAGSGRLSSKYSVSEIKKVVKREYR